VKVDLGGMTLDSPEAATSIAMVTKEKMWPKKEGVMCCQCQDPNERKKESKT
jgi:hypothetical protein